MVESKLLHLAHMEGFPESDESLRTMARSITKFVRNVPVDHPKLGKHGSDIEWLVETISDNYDRVPSARALRELYSQYLPPDTSTFNPQETQ